MITGYRARHQAQHLLVHSPVSLGTAALSASSRSIPVIGAEAGRVGGRRQVSAQDRV